MQIRNLRIFCILSVLGTITLLQLLVLPAMVGVLVDESGLTESMAGWAVSANFLGAALVALVMAFRMHRLHLRRFTTVFLGLAAVCDVLSAITPGFIVLFLFVRFLTGVGAGAAYTCTLAAFARYEDTDKGYGVFVTLQFIVSGVGLYLLPVYATDVGTSGMFLCIACLDLAGVTLARHLPGRAVTGEPTEVAITEIGILFSVVAVLAVSGFCIFEAANTAQFTYVERLGVALEFTEHDIGTALLFASLIGIPGAFSVVFIGDRYGRLKPLLTGICIAVLGLCTLIVTDSYLYYFIGSCCLGFAWAFCLPFIQGHLAALDPNGSVLAGGSFMATIGATVGPATAALVVAGGNYDRVFVMAIGFFILAIICFIASANRVIPDLVLDRQ